MSWLLWQLGQMNVGMNQCHYHDSLSAELRWWNSWIFFKFAYPERHHKHIILNRKNTKLDIQVLRYRWGWWMKRMKKRVQRRIWQNSSFVKLCVVLLKQNNNLHSTNISSSVMIYFHHVISFPSYTLLRKIINLFLFNEICIGHFIARISDLKLELIQWKWTK